MKRYFREVKQRASDFSINPKSHEWWDYWHYHADNLGLGNRGWRYRFEHLRSLAIVYLKIVAAMDQVSTPFQTWIWLYNEDARQDAVYLHTPNANKDNFPLKYDDVTWGIKDIDPFLVELFPNLPIRVGWVRYKYDNENPPRTSSMCFIYSPEIGVPLE